MKIFLWIPTGLLLIFSCTQQANEDRGKPLVKAYENILYDNEIEDLLAGDESPEDSALIINAYIERWLRNQVMLYEAKTQIEDMSGINKLTEDYRSSLILYDYEEQLTNAILDTTIQREELIDYYEEKQKDFVLNHRVIGLIWWKKGEIEEKRIDKSLIRENLVEKGVEYLEVDSLIRFDYLSHRALIRKFPGLSLEALPKNIFSVRRNGVEWRLFILEEVAEGEIAPLPYVRDEIEKLILHRRKIKLLQRIKEDNYQKAMKRNRIKYFN